MEKIDTIQKEGALIKAIFNLSELKELPDTRKINEVFYKLKKEFPDYFDKLKFDENGHFPISDDLDNILDIFEIAGIINFTGKNYLIKKRNRYIEKLKKYIPDVNISDIKKITDKFSEYIK